MPRPSRGYAARIQPPLPPGDHVERPRLRDLLDAAVPKGVALLVAPGGFGKTVALADFARKASFPVAWLSVSATDGDLASFVDAIVAALRRVVPGVGDAAVRAARQPGDAALALAADELTGDLGEHDTPVGLVLDDFHAVDFSREPSRFIAAVLERAPAHFFMAVGSRTLPALPHARLLAAGRLAGITAEDLRFTEDEVARYLGATPDSELAQQLFGRTSGWPAALHLASGSASHAAFDDYLESEVLLQQRPTVREFLLSASVPPMLTEALCRDVLGEPRGGEYLAEAHAQGLFVAALPGGGWRIHDLFRDFLRARLRRTDPARWYALHRQAAGELTPAEGVGLLIDGGLHEDAAAAIETNAGRLVEAGRWGSLRTWLGALPSRVLHGHPRLLTLQARVLSFDADPVDVLRMLDEAAAGCLAVGDSVGAAEAHAYRATRLGASGRLIEAAEDVARVRELLGGRDHRIMATVLRVEGLIAATGGDLGAAQAALTAALARAQRHRDRVEQANVERALAFVANAMGDTGAATAHYDRAVRLLEETGDLRGAAEALIGLGFTYLQQGSPELARKCFDDALLRANRADMRRVRAYALDNLAVIDRESGEVDRAIVGFTTALGLAREIDDSKLVALDLDHLAQCHRMLPGRATTAEALARQALAEAERGGFLAEAVAARTTLAAVLLAQGLYSEALASSEQALTAAEAVRPTAVQVRCRLVAALAGRALHVRTWAAELASAAAAVQRVKNLGFLRAEVRALGAELRALLQVSEAAVAAQAILSAGEGAPIGRPDAEPAPTAPRLPKLKVRLLGKPEILADGVSLPDPSGHWRLAPTRELFFLLEANREGLTPDQIIDRLWPDAAPGRGQQLFWHYAHRLRALLGPDSLVKHDQRWQLSPELEIESDLAAFQGAANRVRTAAAGSADEAASLASAQALYGGRYLDGVWADWAERRRAAIESVHRELVRRQAEHHLTAGEPMAAARMAQGLLRAQPLSEEACRLLLRALIAAGQRVNARQVYHRFARRVEERIGSPPASSIKAFLAGA
jgi:ATP/maltotriose-dependent transcriptional regulator MalT/DNA-binding SARP family transcriptional activator